MRCAITGANGFVGSRIANYLRKQNFDVYEFGRHASKDIDKHHFIPFSLGQEIDKKNFRDIDILIHCAYDLNLTKWKDLQKINVQGSIKLLRTAKEANVKKIILISTLSAFENCVSTYGKAKLAIEKEAQNLGATIVRPGLVFGKDAKGMVGTLNKLISLSKFIPLIGSGNQVLHVCHNQDLARLIYELSTKKTETSAPIVAASEKTLTFKDAFRTLAKAKQKKVFFIPIPYSLVYFGLRLVELLPIKIGLKSDSLVSFNNLNKNIDFSQTKKTGIKFRGFDIYTINQ
jgi:nucleoside-diphosphate-sugar epimerase